MSQIFTTLLVPVDFSAHSAAALHYAGRISRRFFSSVLVLHVIAEEFELRTVHQRLGHRNIPMLGPFSDSLEVPAAERESVAIDLRERAHTALQEFLPPELGVSRPQVLVHIGRPFEQILMTSTDKHADLIVMGTHGRSGLSHTLFGSVAERVVRLASCPVLTVKAPEAPAP